MPSLRLFLVAALQLLSLAAPIIAFQQVNFFNKKSLMIQESTKKRNQCRPSFTCNSLSRTAESKDNLILPIFPLRKRVKFPTEKLKLTLWEDRYKMLSRYVLENVSHPDIDSDQPLFGALYCSHKTQLVRAGRKPVTPLVEVGDIGIICAVTSSQVFINGEDQGYAV